MDRYDWSRLNRLQLGRYAEYLVKMEFTLFGFDVYTAEVDDKGIDFVVRKEYEDEEGKVGYRYYDVQVKSVRGLSYIFFQKAKFAIRDNLLAAVVIFENSELPRIHLIRATAWKLPNALFVGRDYEGLESKPEWGLNLSRKNLPLLEPYEFDRVAWQL